MEERIIWAVIKLNNMLSRLGNRIASRFNLTQQQWTILEILNENQSTGVSLSNLGELLDVTKGNITGLIDRMEANGLAKRKDDPHDRRVIRVFITPYGKKLLKDSEPVKKDWQNRLLAGLSASDKKHLAELLDRVIDRVSQMET